MQLDMQVVLGDAAGHQITLETRKVCSLGNSGLGSLQMRMVVAVQVSEQWAVEQALQRAAGAAGRRQE